jgi:curved DNA-binding protein CbpA
MQQTSRYNYYEILELKSSAPQHAVTEAYERARATYSGDNPAIYTIFSESEAREFLSVIEEAYQILGNKILRNIYDQRLLSGRASLNDLSYVSIIEASKQMFPEPRALQQEISYKKDEAMEKEIKAQEIWSGDFLKKVREYKNVDVNKMSEITKINPFYITAIENIEPTNLPAVVFVRGYVVQLAKALALDEKKVADSYMKIFKESLGKK